MPSRKTATRSVAATVSGIALAMMMAVPAYAVPVSFNNVTATWQNILPNGLINESTPGNGTADAHLNWGTPLPAGGPQSGYEFSVANQPITTDVPVPGNSGDITLGTFIHHNNPIDLGNPISPTASLLSTDLKLTMNVIINGASQGSKDFIFHFTHDETPNNANPCAGPPGQTQPGQGVNANGCADHVTVNDTGLSGEFTVGGVTYTLAIEGFRDPVTGAVHDDFWTRESADNPALLIARVSSLQNISVPEPTSLVLLGSGLLGLALLRRRRNPA